MQQLLIWGLLDHKMSNKYQQPLSLDGNFMRVFRSYITMLNDEFSQASPDRLQRFICKDGVTEAFH